MPESNELPPILQAFGSDLARAMSAAEQRHVRRGGAVTGWARRLPVPVLIIAFVLVLATLAVAAGTVFSTGSPVRPEQLLNPNVGVGMPAAGSSRLLALRVPDPAGGLPWGMRIVHTTRGEVCVQIGRVQNGELGELGIDGAFHDDGRFHRIDADALPADSLHGHPFDPSWGIANANTSCQLAGEAVAGEHVGLDRGAGPSSSASARPLSELRDVSFGLLGPRAVSVRYQSGSTQASEAVVAGVGAYLIVQPTSAGQQIESGYGSLGSEGDLAPIAPLSAITYRLGGQLCERGPSLPPGQVSHLADPCPWPRYTSSAPRTINLHQTLHARVHLNGHLITGVQLTFRAPYAVSSAHQEYLIDIPGHSCGGAAGRRARGEAGGYSQTAVGRNVAAGESVSRELDAREVFVRQCPSVGAHGHLAVSSSVLRAGTIEVRYRRSGQVPVTVGRVTVAAPAGTVASALAGPSR